MPEISSPSIDDNDAASRRVGSLVKGKWHVDGLLGIGGMATVYAATHRNGHRAALKIMHPHLARDSKLVERFLREGYVANKIGHPAVVRVLDDDTSETGEPFLVMELLVGETVRELWKRTGKSLAAIDAMNIAERLLDCLAACHAAGVIHRDLKPANVYVTSTGEIKLLDFGVALLQEAGGATAGLALGTPAYMAPEQARGLANEIDHRIDIFSVGALLHALVSGKRVHRANGDKEALKLAATTVAPSVATIAPDLPDEVVAIVDRALSWKKEDRYPDARAMQLALMHAIEHLRSAPSVRRSSPVESFGETGEQVLSAVAVGDARAISARRAIKAVANALGILVAAGPFENVATKSIEDAATSMASSVARHGAIVVMVLPGALVVWGEVAWAPAPPLDRVLRQLFGAGVRGFRFLPGITGETITVLLKTIAEKFDRVPIESVATALWDLPLSHVRIDLALGFVVVDAKTRDEMIRSREEIETIASSAQRKYAFALSNPSLRAPKITTPLSFSDSEKSEMHAQFAPSFFEERHAEVASLAVLDAAKHGEVPAVLGALRKSSMRAMENGHHVRVMTATRKVAALLARAVGPKDAPKLEAAVMSAAFGKEALTAALANQTEEAWRALAPIFAKLGSSDVPAILSALQKPMTEESAVLLLASAQNVLDDRDEEVVSTAENSTISVRRAIRSWLIERNKSALAERLPKEENTPTAPALPATAEEDLVLALIAICKLATTKQQATSAYQERVGDAATALARLPRMGGPITIEITTNALFMDGELAPVSQFCIDNAQELAASMMRSSGASALVVPRDASAETFRRFGEGVAGRSSYAMSPRENIPSITLVPISELARTRDFELEHLPIEQKVARAYASAVVAMRLLLAENRAAAVRMLALAARALVDGSVDVRAAFLGVSHQTADKSEAALAMSAAILVLAATREITADRSVLLTMALGTMLSAIPRPAQLFSLGWADPETGAPIVIAHDATRALPETLAGRIVSAARRYIHLRIVDGLSADAAMRSLARENIGDQVALRALFAGLGLLPAGTRVELSTGIQADVAAVNEENGARPKVRVLETNRWIDLELEDEISIRSIVSTEGWKEEAKTMAENQLEPTSAAEEPSSTSTMSDVAPTATGDFGTTPLVHVLVYALDRALHGTLEIIEPGGGVHRIGFARGAPTRVRTSRLIAPLGAQLVTAGLLSDADAATAVTNAKLANVPLGHYLVNHDLIARVDLLNALEAQIRLKIAALANLDSKAAYAFYKDVERIPVDATTSETLDVEPLQAIFEAVRGWEDRERVRALVSRYANIPLSVHPDSTIDLLDLHDGERAVLGELRANKKTLASLLERPLASVATILSLLYVLVITRQLAMPGQSKLPMGVRPSSIRPGGSTPAPGRMFALSMPPGASSSSAPPADLPFESAIVSSSSPTRAPSISPDRKRISLADLAAPSSVRSKPPSKPAGAPSTPAKPLRERKETTVRELIRAEQALARKDIQGAERVALKAQTADLEDADLNAFVIWVRVLNASLETAKAIEALGLVISQNEECTRARLYRAKLYRRQNQLKEAALDFERVLAMDPNNKDAAGELQLIALTAKPKRP